MSQPGRRESVVVGIPIDSYGKPGGTELAPAALRELGIVEALGARDAGDLDVRIVGTDRDETSGIMGYPSVVETSQGIRDGLEPLLREDAFLIVLGGCCTLVPGVAAALRLAHSGPLGLAYIDGHLDTYDGKTSPTGEAADMPVAIVAGVGDRALIELGTVTPLVAPSHIAFLGYRDSEEAHGYGAPLPVELGADISHDAASVQRADQERLGTQVPATWVRVRVATGCRSTSTCSRVSPSRPPPHSRTAASRPTS